MFLRFFGLYWLIKLISNSTIKHLTLLAISIHGLCFWIEIVRLETGHILFSVCALISEANDFRFQFTVTYRAHNKIWVNESLLRVHNIKFFHSLQFAKLRGKVNVIFCSTSYSAFRT